jgi:hypothetical protein
VNGCQSISSLYDNSSYITEDLKLLTKFIKLDPSSSEAKMITEFSNNQNGVRPRDFKSNDAIQIRLRQEFADNYGSDYTYEIKRGETRGTGEPISNEDAGLYLMAFDHREPWATHRKYEVFDDKHASLFGRPEVTADRIVFLSVIAEEAEKEMASLSDRLFAGYVLTKYMIIYIIRDLFDDDPKFQEMVHSPKDYVRSVHDRDRFRSCISVFLRDIVNDLNLESKEFGDDFDYRGKLRDSAWVKDVTRRLKADFLRSVSRGKQRSFEKEWDACVFNDKS